MSTLRLHSVLLSAALTVFLGSSAASSTAFSQSISTDKPDYAPGETAHLSGTGFVPGEVVMLRVQHAEGHGATGEDHEPWGVFADETGAFATTWHVCEDDCVGETLVASAEGMCCEGGYAEATFTDAANDGQGVVTLTSQGGTCLSGSGGDVYHWNVAQGGGYTMTITGVTECSGDRIQAFVQSNDTGHFCFPLDRIADGVYSGPFQMPDPACLTYPISYKCDPAATCDRANSFRARGPDGSATVRLRAVTFDANCQGWVEDVNCQACTCTAPPTLVGVPSGALCDGGVTIVDLGCNPDLTTLPRCDPDVTAYDDCGPLEVVCGVSEVVDGCVHIRRIFYDAVNACGPTKCVLGFRWVCDTTAPSITSAGPNLTVDCDAELDFTPPTATDVCSTVTVSQVGDDTVVPGSCAGDYTITRTWVAADGCGNVSDPVSQTITVRDLTAPTIGAPGIDATIDCGSSPVFTPPTATDDCSGATVQEVGTQTFTGNCAASYSLKRTWIAVDGCGNASAPVSQTITVQDTTPPVIGAAGGNVTVACGSVLPFVAPTATDDCSGAIVGQVGADQPVPGACPGTYTVTRTWQAVDGCGNTSGLVSQTISVQDTTPPVIGNPGQDLTVECGSALLFTPPTATDACSGATVDQLGADQTTPGQCAGSYSVKRTWQASDGCGNTSAPVSQTITVQDTTPPVLAGQGADATVECTEPVVFTAPTASDACGAASVEVHSDVTTPACGNTYSRTITWQAVDACGNVSGTVSQRIDVVDTTPPVLVCPPDISVDAGGDCTAQVSETGATASDACDGTVVPERSGPAQGTYPVGVTEVIWTATDACGNTSTCTQRITVNGQVCVTKFYDANANGIREVTEAPIAGWKFQLVGANAPPAAVTGLDGTVCFDVPPGDYSLVELTAIEANWVATTPTTRPVTVAAGVCDPAFVFGNYCFRAPSGGRTIGFWGNPNGLMVLAWSEQNLNKEWRTVLNSLNLRNANGSPFTISTSASFEVAHRSFKQWLQGATATNMAYMLSAQLAATTLSVKYTGLSDDQLVVIPGGVKSGAGVCTVPLLSQAQSLTCAATPLLASTGVAGSTSCGCTSNDGLVKIGDVRARAVCLLGAYGNTTAAGLPRTYEEAVKNLLDMFNNNGNNGYACGGISQFLHPDDDACTIHFP